MCIVALTVEFPAWVTCRIAAASVPRFTLRPVPEQSIFLISDDHENVTASLHWINGAAWPCVNENTIMSAAMIMTPTS